MCVRVCIERERDRQTEIKTKRDKNGDREINEFLSEVESNLYIKLRRTALSHYRIS